MPRIFLQCMVAVVAALAHAMPVVAQPVAPLLPPVSNQPSDASAGAPLNDLPALTLPQATVPVLLPQPSAPSSVGLPPVVGAPTSVPSTAVDGAVGAQVSEPVVAEKIYSFGDSNLSILFLPDQVTRMKDALRTFEDSGQNAAALTPVAPVAAANAVPEVIEDPLVYPVFYLASIAYDTPKDWSLWLSGYKITSRKNLTDVTVLNVTRDSASFLWTPSFGKAMVRRTKDKLFAPVDPVKNKLAGLQRASFDEGTGSVVFTLKQNQTFAVGYFKMFEGYIDGPTLTPLPVVAAAPANGSPAALDAAGQPIPQQPVPNPQAGSFNPPTLNFNGSIPPN